MENQKSKFLSLSKRRIVMKRFIVCVSIFLLVFIITVGSSEAVPETTKITLKIYYVYADLDLDYIDIYGENFGMLPEVMLDSLLLTVLSSSDTLIQAALPGGLEPGTYRLIVEDGLYNNPQTTKKDSMDVTMGAV
jgi:hypothetical protein